MSGSVIERARRWLDANHPVITNIYTADLEALLAAVEAAQFVHASLHREFSHSLAMRDLGKALRALYATAPEGDG